MCLSLPGVQAVKQFCVALRSRCQEPISTEKANSRLKFKWKQRFVCDSLSVLSDIQYDIMSVIKKEKVLCDFDIFLYHLAFHMTLKCNVMRCQVKK